MRVLIGTTNPAKVNRFAELLKGNDMEFLTLAELKIEDEPEENGNNPEENARIKAAFYGQYFDRVICNDSGLYFDMLPLDDIRQPGLHVRTPQGGRRLDDAEMIRYYTRLVHSLGGKVLAYYLDGIAVYNKGKVYSFMDEEAARRAAFYMVDQPVETWKEGWPLDSMSIDCHDRRYFSQKDNSEAALIEENIITGAYQKRLTAFLRDALES